ncbi:DNA_helicase [Hexamita inflata]|uniref:Putative n=1 Tax=Hexamita inflata TaxID=28002 RepID=A0AA86TSJ1_9EUKA|nr:DNA helicase [Hexamita inflata]
MSYKHQEQMESSQDSEFFSDIVDDTNSAAEFDDIQNNEANHKNSNTYNNLMEMIDPDELKECLQEKVGLLDRVEPSYENTKDYIRQQKRCCVLDLKYQQLNQPKIVMKVDIQKCELRILTSIQTEEEKEYYIIVNEDITLNRKTGVIQIWKQQHKIEFEVDFIDNEYNTVIAQIKNVGDTNMDVFINDKIFKSREGQMHMMPNRQGVKVFYLSQHYTINAQRINIISDGFNPKALINRILKNLDLMHDSPFEDFVTGRLKDLKADSMMNSGDLQLDKLKRQIANSTRFNTLQKQALWYALNHKVSLISGLAGTGKTYTLCGIAKQFQHHGCKILMCAPNQTSQDALCDQLKLWNIKYVRVYAKSLNDDLFHLNSSKLSILNPQHELHHICVSKIVEMLEMNDGRDFSEAEAFKLKEVVNYGHDIDPKKITQLFCEEKRKKKQDKTQNNRVFNPKDRKAEPKQQEADEADDKLLESLQSKYFKIMQQTLEEARVIVTSPLACGDSRFQHIEFDVGLFDDFSRVRQHYSIVPVMKCSQRLVLASDQNQHKVRSRFEELMAKNFGLSMFDNLVELKQHTILREQMRCHPKACILNQFPQQKDIQQFEVAGDFLNLRKFPCALYNVRKDDFYDSEQKLFSNVLTELIGLYRVKDIAIIVPKQQEKEIIQLLLTEINMKLKPDRVSIQILTPNEIIGKEFDAVVLSLFLMYSGYNYNPYLLESVLTRHKRIFVAFASHVDASVYKFFKEHNANVNLMQDVE